MRLRAPFGVSNSSEVALPCHQKNARISTQKKFFRRVLTIGAYVLEILDVTRESINWEICLPRFRCLCSSLNKKKSELFWYVK